MKLRRSMLFMPGNTPAMLQSADVLGADSIILDLEDAVSLEEKDSARTLVREAVKFIGYDDTEVVVRINPYDTPYFNEDINQIGRVHPSVIMLPKADEKAIEKTSEILDDIEHEMGFKLGSIKIMPIAETAYGVENVYSIIRASKRVDGVLFGAEDFTSDMGIKRTKVGSEISYARNRIAVACRAARISSIDTPFTDTNDFEGLRSDTELAKSLGMTGKASINPRQINIINEVYTPTAKEIAYARKVLSEKERAEAEGRGVFSLNGKMVDAPVINRARTVVELSKKLGIL